MDDEVLCEWCGHDAGSHLLGDNDVLLCDRGCVCSDEAPDWANEIAGDLVSQREKAVDAWMWQWDYERALEVLSGERPIICPEHAVHEPCPACQRRG